MIIIGYPGIGKSSLAGRNNCIDLESSHFWHKGERAANWAIYYCNIANDLSQQGYNVFVSSHGAVQEQLLKSSKEQIVIIYPSLSLKEEWINKLKVRHMITELEKDLKAYDAACQSYDAQIQAMMESSFEKIEIDNMNYSLNKIIWEIQNKNLYNKYKEVKP
mgnify:CR=1 FL=1